MGEARTPGHDIQSEQTSSEEQEKKPTAEVETLGKINTLFAGCILAVVMFPNAFVLIFWLP